MAQMLKGSLESVSCQGWTIRRWRVRGGYGYVYGVLCGEMRDRLQWAVPKEPEPNPDVTDDMPDPTYDAAMAAYEQELTKLPVDLENTWCGWELSTNTWVGESELPSVLAGLVCLAADAHARAQACEVVHSAMAAVNALHRADYAAANARRTQGSVGA